MKSNKTNSHSALKRIRIRHFRYEKRNGAEMCDPQLFLGSLWGTYLSAKIFFGITFLGSTHLHTPNWHFTLTRHSETFPFSYMKFLSTESKYLEFLRKKIGKGLSRTRTRSVASAVHLPYHYATENLLTIDGLIWRYIATTLTPNRS